MTCKPTEVFRRAALVGGVALLVTLFLRLGPTRVLSLLASLGYNFVVVVALFAAHEFMRTLAITRWLPADTRPSVAELLRIRFLGEAAGALTRTGSLAAEPARAWLLANRSGRVVHGYSAAAGELMANSATSAAVNVAVAGWMLLTGRLTGPLTVLAHVLFWGSLVYMTAVVSIVLSRVRILGMYARLAARLPLVGRRLRMDPLQMREMQRAITAALTDRKGVLARILLLELSAQALLVSEVYWTMRSMGMALSGPTALFIEVMTRPLTVIELVGATETGFAVVFTWLGMPAAIGFTLSLIKTLRSLAAAGIGIGLLPHGNRARPQHVSTLQARGAVLDPGT